MAIASVSVADPNFFAFKQKPILFHLSKMCIIVRVQCFKNF